MVAYEKHFGGACVCVYWLCGLNLLFSGVLGGTPFLRKELLIQGSIVRMSTIIRKA